MLETKLKEIRKFNAIDVTNLSSTESQKLYDEICPIKHIACACGTYGVTGLLFYSEKTRKYYKVTSRTSGLYVFM